MKHLRIYVCIFVCIVFVLVVGESAQATPQAGTYKCAKDASGILNCQRIAPAGRLSGQTGTYVDSSSGKACKWKCTTAKGLETCKASSTECGSKLPPHWK